MPEDLLKAPEKTSQKPEKVESDAEFLKRIQPSVAQTKTHLASYRNFVQALKEATKDPKREYSSEEARATMKFETQMRCNGKIPRWYQEDSGEAFSLGMDVVLVSATGSGKTLSFLQSLLADKTGESKLIIISPLNELEYDMVCLFIISPSDSHVICAIIQVKRCNDMGLPALAVNGDTWAADKSLHQVCLETRIDSVANLCILETFKTRIPCHTYIPGDDLRTSCVLEDDAKRTVDRKFHRDNHRRGPLCSGLEGSLPHCVRSLQSSTSVPSGQTHFCSLCYSYSLDD